MSATPSSGWAIKAENLSLSYRVGRPWNRKQVIEVLTEISFEVRQGETFGVIGKNGCGKSSLLRVLAGVIRQNSGTLDFQKIESKSLLSLGLGFNMDLSGRDNALLSLMLQGKSKIEAMEMLGKINEFSELEEHFELPVRTYSTGMRSRLGFSVAITANTDLLLIDETLSVGDAQFRKKAEHVMKQKLQGNQTIVFVSHNAEQIANLCQNAIWLDDGNIRASGDTKEVANEYKDYIASLSK
jgi:lipopolysaccharide transport system ATP-binding protein